MPEMKYWRVQFPAWGNRSFYVEAPTEKDALNMVDYSAYWGPSNAIIEEITKEEYDSIPWIIDED
jgi:hypothetical protein